MERELLVYVQSTLLTGLVVISDLIALTLILTMAIGTRSKFTQNLPGYLVDANRFEAILGPFWIYLCAILFHMLAASITCLIGINRKYVQYLKVIYKERKRLEINLYITRIKTTTDNCNPRLTSIWKPRRILQARLQWRNNLSLHNLSIRLKLGWVHEYCNFIQSIYITCNKLLRNIIELDAIKDRRNSLC